MKSKLIIVFLFVVSAWAQEPKQKVKIDPSTIRYVEILKVNTNSKMASLTKRLTNKQTIHFAQKWNRAASLGADKYRMTYFVYVHLKNGTKRQFSIKGNKIQEDNWMTYDMGDALYFDTLWKTIR